MDCALLEIYPVAGRNFPPGHFFIFFTKWIAIGAILLYNNNALLYTFIDILILGKEKTMERWQMYLLTAGSLLLMLILWLRKAVKRSRDQKNRAFARKLETVLQSRETVKLICPQKSGQVILTSRRLLFETDRGFQAVALKDIKRTQGFNAEGKKTTSLNQMTRLTLKAEKEYTIANTSAEFVPLAKQVISRVASQNRKKKAAREKKREKK